ncbi:MAG: hypothetical protein A2Z29_07890 [Chloroflexi bacterium RBG_16_56_11]|nr:MAG: hypothetical protein A2Z29_07890 [Chloroflexi bacterium RBG_16_56_11]
MVQALSVDSMLWTAKVWRQVLVQVWGKALVPGCMREWAGVQSQVPLPEQVQSVEKALEAPLAHFECRNPIPEP